MSGLIPILWGKSLSGPGRRTQQEPVEQDSRTPIPQPKSKFDRMKDHIIAVKKSRNSPKTSPVDMEENNATQKRRTAQFSPPPPIVVDTPPHGVPSDTSDQEPERNQANFLNHTTLDAARKAASEALDNMIPLSERSEVALSTIDQAEIPISSFLKSLKLFNSIVDGMAEVHPYANAAWSILSVASKKILDQNDRDVAVCSLFFKMNEVYVSLIKAGLSEIESVKEVVERISQQTLECAYFIQEYAQNEKFRTRFFKNLVSDTDKRMQTYNDVFDELRQQFLCRAVGDTVIVVHRIWEKVERLVQEVDLSSMPYVGGAGFNTQKICLEGTRREILDEITSWVNCAEDDTPPILWLHGNAGTGKSFISHTIAHRFKKIGRLGSCFCFDRTRIAQERDQRIFSTIARDLADQDKHMKTTLMDAIRGDTSLKNTMDILQQWKEMILKPAQRLSEEMVGPVLIIIDALDESGAEQSRKLLLRILAGKTRQESHITKLPSQFRILVTSRPLPDIYIALHRVGHIRQMSMDGIPHQMTERDILRFIKQEMSDVEEMNHEHASALMLASDGLFEWARLACELIKSVNEAGTTASKRFDDVIASSKGGQVGLLDSMYELTLKSIFPEGGIRPRSTRIALFRSVMAQVIGTAKPLPLDSLRSMRRYFVDKDFEEDELDVIIKPLGALLRGTTNSRPIRPLHASFPEFLTDRERSGEFFVDLSHIHAELACACLGVMTTELQFNICGLPSSYLLNSQVYDLEERIEANITPQLSYSCRYWAEHLRHTSFSPLANKIRDFFNNERLLFWFEVLSLENKINICTSLLSFVIEWCMQRSGECKDICDDAADAQKFVRTFGRAISLSTPHLYISAVPFSPKNSHISKKFRERFGMVLKFCEGWNDTWPSFQDALHERSYCVAFSPDSKRIVSGSVHRSIQLWDAETGEQLLEQPLVRHQYSAMSVAFSLDGKRIVSGSDDKTIRLWDAETGEQVQPPFEGHQDVVTSVAFFPNGKRIVSGSCDNTIRVWDAETGEQIGAPLEGHQSWVLSVGCSPNGKHIASGSWDRTIRMWDAETGKQVQPPLEGHQDVVESVAFSPDGKHIVSGSDDRTIRLWDVETGEQLQPPLEGHQDAVRSVAFSSDGKCIVSGSDDNTIRMWDAETGEQVGAPFKGHQDWVWSVGFSPDGKRIVSVSRDRTIRIWDAKPAEQLQPFEDSILAGMCTVSEMIGVCDEDKGGQQILLEGHQSRIYSVAFSPDGKHIVSGSSDKTIRLWDAGTGKQLQSPLKGHADMIYSVAFSPDGRHIVSCSRDAMILLWDLETGELGPPLTGHRDCIQSVGFSPDGRRIVSGSDDKTIRIWDSKTGNQLRFFEGHQDKVISVAFSPDGKRIASGSDDKTIRLWDVETGEQVQSPFQGHQDRIVSVTFSPNGKHIVSGSDDKTIRVWDAETGEQVGAPLEGHGDAVVSVAFSPDGKRIVSGSGDRTIRLWDAETGEKLEPPLEGHQSWVWSVGFSPDGKSLVSGSFDNTIRLWDVETLGEQVRSALETPNLKLLQHLIRFSSQLDHGLFKPVELFNQISETTPSPATELVYMKADGWVLTGPMNSLLFWSPPMYQPRLYSLKTQLIMPAPSVQLDLSNMAHGSLWHLCYNPR